MIARAIAPPGSLLWLMRHEMRLNLRRWLRRRGRPRRARAFILPLALVFFQAMALIMLSPLRHWHEPPPSPTLLLALSGFYLGGFLLSFSLALDLMVETLYFRGDYDLIGASPFSARKLLSVKLLAIAFSASQIWLLFVLPFANAAALYLGIHWLLAYPLIFCQALLATVLALIFALAMFAAIGPRRTRQVAQVLTAVTGALAVISSQTPRYWAANHQSELVTWFSALAHSPSGDLLSLPARALFGEVTALILSIGVPTALFAAAVAIFAARYAANFAAIQSLGQRQVAPRASALRWLPKLRGMMPILIAKELRLIIRDPALISQTLFQMLYLVPAMLGILQVHVVAERPVSGWASMLVAALATLVSALAWITISAEDSPDLLAAAPIAPRLIQQAKLLAAIAPVAVLVLPFAIWFSMQSLFDGLWFALGCAGGGISSGLLQLWYGRPGKRTEFRGSRRLPFGIGLMQLLIILGWCMATALAILGSFWAAAPALAALALLVMLGPEGLLSSDFKSTFGVEA